MAGSMQGGGPGEQRRAEPVLARVAAAVSQWQLDTETLGGITLRVWVPAFPHPLLRDGFQAWNAHSGTGKSTTNSLER